MRTLKNGGSESLLKKLESFLEIQIPKQAIDHGTITITEAEFFEEGDLSALLPEKGPFLFFKDCPIAFAKSGKQVFLFGVMNVKDTFCEGHFGERVVLPLYMVGGAAGQLCAMYTAHKENGGKMMPVATEGSATSLGKDFIDVNKKLFFAIKLVLETKRGFDFEYSVYCDQDPVAEGKVGSISIPRRMVFRNK